MLTPKASKQTGHLGHPAWGGGDDFEIHVYDPSGDEAGIVSGFDGWIGKHGFSNEAVPPGIPDQVLNTLNGVNVNELRSGGALPAKGLQNIKGGRYLNPGRTLFPVLSLLPGLLDEYLNLRDLELKGRKHGLTPQQENCSNSLKNGNPRMILDPLVGIMPNPCYVSPWSDRIT